MLSEKGWLVTIWVSAIINFAFVEKCFDDIKKQNQETQNQIKELKLELIKKGR